MLYRKVWKELPTDRMRLIMPTMVGLGFSTKIPASQHTLENHIRWMNAALRQLDPGGLVYVGQDWGGAVGLGALMRSPELLRGMVLLNTGFSAPKEKFELSRPHAIAATPIMGEILLENVVSVFDRIHEAQGDPASIPPEVAALYARPVRESGNIKGPLALMRMVPTGPDHPTSKPMSEIEAYAGTLKVPTEIVWGMRDPILARLLPTMTALYPEARVTETEAGHFLQEEVPVEIAEAIERVVAEVERAGKQ
jgi:haloalkane dehalogenase